MQVPTTCIYKAGGAEVGVEAGEDCLEAGEDCLEAVETDKADLIQNNGKILISRMV